MFTMDTMEAPQPGTPGKDGEDEPSHNKLEDMIKELGTALTGNYTCILEGYAINNRRKNTNLHKAKNIIQITCITVSL